MTAIQLLVLIITQIPIVILLLKGTKYLSDYDTREEFVAMVVVTGIIMYIGCIIIFCVLISEINQLKNHLPQYEQVHEALYRLKP